MKYAGIDIGTNTTRLIIYDKEKNKVIEKRRIITRLGENFNGYITENSLNRLLETLNYFKEIMYAHRIFKYRAIATSALRESKNKENVIKVIKEKTGINVEIIDALEEAKLTFDGVLWSLDKNVKNFLLLDIGGGSNEYTLAIDRKIYNSISLNFGVVFLYEKFIKSDPPIYKELENLENEIDKNINLVKNKINKLPENTKFVGTAGTITTLSAIHQNLKEYDPQKINNHKIPYQFIKNLFSEMIKLKNEERLKKYHIEKGREDVIIPGILITLKTMEHFNFNEVISIDSGLLEGIVINIGEKDENRKP